MIKNIYIFKHGINNMPEALDFELGQVKNAVDIVISDKSNLVSLIICYSNTLSFFEKNFYKYSINMYAVDAGDLRMAILKYQLKDEVGAYKYKV